MQYGILLLITFTSSAFGQSADVKSEVAIRESEKKNKSVAELNYERGTAALQELKSIGMSNRMFQLDNGMYATGNLRDDCSGECAAPKSGKSKKSLGVCSLVQCHYILQKKWSQFGYKFEGHDRTNAIRKCGCSGVNIVACAKREGAEKDSEDKNWGYAYGWDGSFYSCGGAPLPPLTPKQVIRGEFRRCYRNSEGDSSGECKKKMNTKLKELKRKGKQ